MKNILKTTIIVFGIILAGLGVATIVDEPPLLNAIPPSILKYNAYEHAYFIYYPFKLTIYYYERTDRK